MVKQEIIKNLKRTYTDNPNKVLLQVETNIKYGNEVYDVKDSKFTYIEVDKK